MMAQIGVNTEELFIGDKRRSRNIWGFLAMTKDLINEDIDGSIEKNKNADKKARPPKILLVEDEPIGQLIGKGFLENLGCDFTIVGDAQSALACFMDHDLVLLDLGLPDIDGREACMIMRTKNTQIPILAYTVLMGGERMRRLCAEAGFTDYLEKPVGRLAMYNALIKYLPKKLIQCLKRPEDRSDKK